MNIESLRSAAPLRRWRLPLAGVVLAAALLAGWLVVKSQNSGATEKSVGAKAVDFYELAAADIASVEERVLTVALPMSGSLIPVAQATIKAKVAAEVKETTVLEGTRVTAGQVIARLDTADLQARHAAQQAAVEESQAKLALAIKNRDNSQALLKQRFISQNAFDTTENAVDLARANLKSAMAQREIARLALADAAVRAPLSGSVSKRHVQPGDKVSPDMPIYTVVDLSQLILEAQVPTSEIPRVRVGQEVQFTVDGFAGRSFAGTVARVSPTAEAGSRVMLVYVSVTNGDGTLRGGMFASGRIVLEKSSGTATVPIAAVRQENGASVVYRVVDGKVETQPVQAGLRSEQDGLVQIAAGLSKGDIVVVTRLAEIKPGVTVKLPWAAAGS
jgi:RND family efflux transporter MFP subunit